MATLKTGLNQRGSLTTDSLGGPGPIAYDPTGLDTVNDRKKEIIDYIRLRLADGIVDVELDQDHYNLAITNALRRYRQKSSASVEESYAFLELLPETQEYILPQEVVQVRQIFRRGIGSVTGTTASQFEPFASGYLNTYMLVAGRVGGLTNYELFVQYQEQAMKMFGGHMNFTWNSVTKKLTIVRKIPETGRQYQRLTSLTANATAVGSTISMVTQSPWPVSAGNTVVISNCRVSGYNGSYVLQTANTSTNTYTVTASSVLASTTVTDHDLRSTQLSSPVTDEPAESVMLWLYNYKPDQMILNDTYAFPWIQDYAYALSKMILGEARSKFASLAGPQGGTQLNGTALIAEGKEEIQKLEDDIKAYVDGASPLTWVIG